VGGILEVQGVTEVTPYARIKKLVAWRRRAAKNCRYPLFWVNKRQKKTQTTINRYDATCEGCGGLQGGTEVTPGALLLMFPRRRRRAALDSRNTPRGQKNHKHGVSQQSASGRGRVGAAGGRAGMYKYNKVIK